MKIEKLVLLTNDLGKTKDFYSGKLNLKILEEREDSISLRAGTTALIFRLSAISNPVYHFAFNIPCNKAEEALEWCESSGFKILPYMYNKVIDFRNWNAKSIYFLDNHGSILEFIGRFDLKNETASGFDTQQILSISEVGIVVDDVIRFCENANKEYDITFYTRQKPALTFSVLGDAEGLMIVVPEKRSWFPTSIPSIKVPIEMTFAQNGKEFVFKG